ncbi:DUF1120 domain-containing protein [Pantoea coffeiphila]|uniref:DUF1120 domain-containing protein n=1 Tax=Pantoea coffeiphila TaxID=1465635 RepID=A0A2S9IDV6_9GAMM|nr:DUF1120 domain-containing protein [Pantoea coffeiphila]PRD15975.1 hypothetical protein CQW29_07535 [Pantoea coffeiphila]
MKKKLLLVSVLSGLAISGAASAATSQVTMKLEGSIIPATCNININGGTSSTLSLGKISAAQLKPGQMFELEDKAIRLNINCPSPTMVGFQVMDLGQKAGQVDMNGTKGPSLFSLGTTKSGAIAGGYVVHLEKGTIDAQNVYNFISSETGETWQVSNGTLNSVKKDIISWGATSTLSPSIGLSHQIDMSVHSYINPIAEKDISDKIDLRGEATYDLVYL